MPCYPAYPLSRVVSVLLDSHKIRGLRPTTRPVSFRLFQGLPVNLRQNIGSATALYSRS